MRILDLFCGAGGAAMGYHRAGFEVVGVDIKPQPRYPFEFVQDHALGYLAEIKVKGWQRVTPRWFDAIHASPPCQAYSPLRHTRPEGIEYPDMVAATRALLDETGLPYVIENVQRAPLRASFMLCGSSFGLGSNGRMLKRHRYFEINWDLGTLIPPCDHRGREAIGVYGGGPVVRSEDATRGGYQGLMVEREEAMGIDWMNREELAEAVPPVYTEFIGERLLTLLG
jgi:DNA (cytosine-5)-methyltransferase 1